MSRLQKLLGGAALLVLAAACTAEKDFQPAAPDSSKDIITITASTDASTKATLIQEGETFSIRWSADDAISLLESGVNYKFTTDESSLKEEGRRATFSHEGEIGQQAYYALYPYDAAASFADGKVITTLPTEQTAVAGSFAREASLALARADWGKSFNFLNAVAWAQISFKTTDTEAQIKKITIRSIDESVLLSGTVALTPVLDSEGELTGVTLAVTDGLPYASIVAPEGSFLTPEVNYYLSVAPGALTSGYRVELETADGLTFTKDYSGDLYNAATFQRNIIAPVGRKNLDNYETGVEAYWRFTSDDEFGEGSYLLGYPMGNGNIRIFDESKTDCFISGGTDLVNKFSNVSLLKLASAWSTWTSGGESPTIMRHYVLWAFREAYVDTDSDTNVNGFAYADEDLILNPNDRFRIPIDGEKTLTMKLGYRSNGQKYKDVQLTGCSLTIDNNNGVKLIGRITETSIENLIDIFYISKGSAFTSFASKSDALIAAKKACGKDTTVGFCTQEQTTNAGDKMNNMFMVQNYHLCSTPTPAAIWLYKKGVKNMSYAKYKEIYN